jgi:hypothetical protein
MLLFLFFFFVFFFLFLVASPSTLTYDVAKLQPNSASTFLSPNFPHPVPSQLGINYMLRAPIGYLIHVTIHHFRMTSSPRPPSFTNGTCSEVLEIDDVSLTESYKGIPKRLATLCGDTENVVNETVSELNSVRIMLKFKGNVNDASLAAIRRRRDVTASDSLGFNISVRVYPGNQVHLIG